MWGDGRPRVGQGLCPSPVPWPSAGGGGQRSSSSSSPPPPPPPPPPQQQQQSCGDPVVGTVNYCRAYDAEVLAEIRAQVASPSSEAVSRGGSGVQGAGRFFTDPRQMNIHDARPAMGQLSIDRHGIVLARKTPISPGDARAWRFSDELEAVLDPKDVSLRRDYYPELEALACDSVMLSDGRRPTFAVCAATQKFTEDKSRGYLGAYARQVHTDVFTVRPEFDDKTSGLWDPSGWDCSDPTTATVREKVTGPTVGVSREAARAAAQKVGRAREIDELCMSDTPGGSGSGGETRGISPPPLVHPYAAMVFGGGFSSAAIHQRRHPGQHPPLGTSTADGPENLLRSRGIPLEVARCAHHILSLCR